MKVLLDSRSIRLLPILLVAPLVSGCSRAPSVDVAGSFFPAWLVSFLAGIVLVACVRLALLRLQMKVAFPVLVYPSLAAFFTFALWLIFYY
jgi:fructose-specific phosphotransferase system IIC component